MTVVNPKSISGINSITMASGSDNLLTIHTNDTSEKVRVNSSGDVIVGSGVTLSPDGNVFATGVTTTGSLVSSSAITAGKLVKLAPDPLNVVAVHTPVADISPSGLTVIPEPTITSPELLILNLSVVLVV